MRSQQRDATREQILSAALDSISESGYDGVSTRKIAGRAGVTQGLLSYHFKSKDALWRAAADHLFGMLDATIDAGLAALDKPAPSDIRRETVRQLVQFAASHPELMRFMMDAGVSGGSGDWLVETHIQRFYKRFCDSNADMPAEKMPHLFYIMTGASMLIYCTSSKCQALSGLDPRTPAAIETHAEMVADLIETMRCKTG